jgi:hypothetical protein
MNTVRYVGGGAEVEDDAARLRRRKLEFDEDAARRSRQRGPRPWQALGLLGRPSAAVAHWRSRKPVRC